MAKINRVSRSLYRSLLKIARNFDETPACKALLYRTDLYNTNKSAVAKYYTTLLGQLFEKDSYLFQPKDGAISLVQLIREESRSTNEKISTSERLDAGFAALRKLSSLWGIYNTQADEEEDEEERLHEELNQEPFTVLNSDVSLATALSSGVLLLAHPMLQGPLHRSVILLLEHNSKGSYGVIINHRTGHSVRSSVKNLPENILEVFGHSSVAFGGMVRRLTYLHNVQQVGGVSIPTCKKPLYAGGEILKALTFVKEARAASTAVSGEGSEDSTTEEDSLDADPTERFRFFVGCCLWEGGNLEKELASGYWIPTHSEPDTVLELAMLTAVLPDGEEQDSVDADIDTDRNIATYTEVEKELEAEKIDEVREAEAPLAVDVPKKDINEVERMLDEIRSSDKKEQREQEYFSDEEEEYSVDVWKALLRSLGQPYAAMADLPPWVSAKDVESADWK